VSINYRLGVFGFMAHPGFDAADNGAYGLEDQRLALRWVQRNIGAFGGDPHNVTIAGESAGAASVGFHLIAPDQTQGLFQKAIIQSAGFASRLKSVEDANKTGVSIAEAVGCTDPATAADCLRQTPVGQLLAAQVTASKTALLAFVPAAGTPVLPQQGSEALASGQFVRVPILNGGNEQEMRLFVGYDVAAGARITAANYPALIVSTYGPAAPKVLELYPLSNYSSPPAAAGTAFSDYLQSIPIGHCYFLKAATLAARYVPVYEYEFADAAAPPVEPDPGFEMGAVHSAELPYLFAHFSNNEALDGPELAPKSRRLADQIVDLWSSFAHGGSPRASGVPRWPVYRGGRTVMRLAPGRPALFDASRAHHCADWQALFPEDLSGVITRVQ
jgi:para-nitrobenzyl esterase